MSVMAIARFLRTVCNVSLASIQIQEDFTGDNILLSLSSSKLNTSPFVSFTICNIATISMFLKSEWSLSRIELDFPTKANGHCKGNMKATFYQNTVEGVGVVRAE